MSVLSRLLSILFFVFLFLGSQNSWGQAFSVQEKVYTYKPYWFSGFTRADYALNLYDVGGGKVSTYSFINANYRLGAGKKVTLRIPFIISSAGWDQFEDKAPTYHTPDAFFEDPILSLVNGSLALLPGDIQVYWEGRFYIPVGQQSRLENRIARLRNDFIFSKNLTQKWEVNWVNNINYYIQSRTTYVTDIPQNDETGETLEVLTNTRAWRIDNRFDLWYKYSYDLGFGMQFATRSDVFYQAPNQNRTKSSQLEYSFGPQVRFSMGDFGNMIASVSNTVPKQDFDQLLNVKRETLAFALLAFYSF